MPYRSLALLFALVVSPPVTGSVRAADTAGIPGPLVDDATVFGDVDGVVVVEAEHYFRQTLTDVRMWHLFHAGKTPEVTPDGDPPHLAGASGGAYLEVLPDTRRTHGDRLVRGENFCPEPGKMAVLHYRVHFRNAGRYWVWARIFSTGTEDNGLHVGIDGTWPASGQRMQWTAKRKWYWDSKQRTATTHTGERYKLYLDVASPGVHTISFSMREDGIEFDKWLMTREREFPRPDGAGPAPRVSAGKLPDAFPPVAPDAPSSPAPAGSESVDPVVRPRRPDGSGAVAITGELRRWHKVTITQQGPFAHELDNDPNPFLDYRMTVTFVHESGSPRYRVPGYFAADGAAGETSAEAGTAWRAHLSPDEPGRWDYRVAFVRGRRVAVDPAALGDPVAGCDGKTGSFVVSESDKEGRDLRARGRLQWVGKHHLRFAGTGEFFLKAGADAPETLLAYEDFDGTSTRKTPLKSWKPHVRDWRAGDPAWKGGKGKGLIGALDYLAGKGCNAFSFLTYNAGGDGDNVWPFVSRDAKLHYDCSKLDQWQIVFDHAQSLGLYLHFKTQETEIDGAGKGGGGRGGTALDGGELGEERRLYYRELIARFGHELALNWNLGEENDQTPAQQRAMARYIRDTDPYDHHIVIHTFPGQQNKVYEKLLGERSVLTGASLQNGWDQVHRRTVEWVRKSAAAGRPWVVANDEQGSAATGVPPDPGYERFRGKDRKGNTVQTIHDIRRYTLWGNLMAGGAGVEYYFGYQLPQNDLECEDFRSRDRSWDYCRHALALFAEQAIPFPEMRCADELVGNEKNDNSRFCLVRDGDVYLVYLPEGGSVELDLTGVSGSFAVEWYDPRRGGALRPGSVRSVEGGGSVSLGTPPAEPEEDWVAVVRKRSRA